MQLKQEVSHLTLKLDRMSDTKWQPDDRFMALEAFVEDSLKRHEAALAELVEKRMNDFNIWPALFFMPQIWIAIWISIVLAIKGALSREDSQKHAEEVQS